MFKIYLKNHSDKTCRREEIFIIKPVTHGIEVLSISK